MFSGGINHWFNPVMNLGFYNYSFHFWAPTFKWVISIANVADFSKPPEQLSYPHQTDFFVRFCSCCNQWTHLVSLQHADHPRKPDPPILKLLRDWKIVCKLFVHDYYTEPEPAEAKNDDDES
ncbi:hypothetical protein C3L33_09806, partial [Rhododendron williamsianum]